MPLTTIRWRARRLCAVLAVWLAFGPHWLAAERLFEIKKLREQRFSQPILSVDAARAPALAATALADGHVRVSKLDTGETIHEFDFPQPEENPHLWDEKQAEPAWVRFSPDGGTLAVSYLSRIYLYATATWKQVASLGVEGEDAMRPIPPPHFAERPAHPPPPQIGSEQLYENLAKGDGRTRVLDFAFTRDGRSILASYCRGDCSVYTPWPDLLVIPSGNDPMRLWDLQSRCMVWEYSNGPNTVVRRVTPSPDSKIFAAMHGTFGRGGGLAVEIRNLTTGQELFSLQPCSAHREIPNLLFSPDGAELITCPPRPEKFDKYSWKHLAIYSTKNGSLEATYPGYFWPNGNDLSPDGRWLAGISPNAYTFFLEDLNTHKRVYERFHFLWGMTGPVLTGLRLDPSGHYLIVTNSPRGLLAVYRIFDSGVHQ